jgi:hypothetical protein
MAWTLLGRRTYATITDRDERLRPLLQRSHSRSLGDCLYTVLLLICGLYIILYVCLFNDAFNSSAHTASDDKMNNELERIWKETVVA